MEVTEKLTSAKSSILLSNSRTTSIDIPGFEHLLPSVQESIKVEIKKNENDRELILNRMKLSDLKPSLEKCPSAYRFMSINYILKHVIIKTLDKKLDENSNELQKTIVDLNNLLSNIYKGEVQSKKMRFDTSTIVTIKILAIEIDDLEMKNFLTSLADCIGKVVSKNFTGNIKTGYDIPKEMNFFDIPISEILKKSELFESIQERERTRVYLGTFFPLAARTSFEVARFTNQQIKTILHDVVYKKFPNFIKISTLCKDGIWQWLMQKQLLLVKNSVNELEELQGNICEALIRPSLEKLSPSYLTNLQQNNDFTSLNKELVDFSNECNTLCEGLIHSHESISAKMLLINSILEQFPAFINWSNSTGFNSFIKFKNENPSIPSKELNFLQHQTRFARFMDEIMETKGYPAMIKLVQSGSLELSKKLSPEAQNAWNDIQNDLKIMMSLITFSRLQNRSHVGLVDNYRSLEETKVQISTADNVIDETDLTLNDVALPLLNPVANKPVSENNETETLPTIKIEEKPETTAKIEREPDPIFNEGQEIDFPDIVKLHEAFFTAFANCPYSHPLALKAFQDAGFAHRNLVAELMLPSVPTEPIHVISHINALVRFTSTMMEELSTAIVIEQKQPSPGDFSLLKHTIPKLLEQTRVNKQFIDVALKGEQLEQRMRYLYTDENSVKLPTLSLLHLAEGAKSPEELQNALTKTYEFVRENLEAIASVLGIQDVSYAKINGDFLTSENDTKLPSEQHAKILVDRLGEIELELNGLLQISPCSKISDQSQVSNYLADTARLTKLVRGRLLRKSDAGVEYVELSTLLPLAIESLIIAIAGRTEGTLNLGKIDRKRMGHNLLELFCKNQIGQLLLKHNLGFRNQSHFDFMKESRKLLSLTRYRNLQQMAKGNKLDGTLVNQIKASTADKVHVLGDDWTPAKAPAKKKVQRAQREAKLELLERTQKGVGLLEDLLNLYISQQSPQ